MRRLGLSSLNEHQRRLYDEGRKPYPQLVYVIRGKVDFYVGASDSNWMDVRSLQKGTYIMMPSDTPFVYRAVKTSVVGMANLKA